MNLKDPLAPVIYPEGAEGVRGKFWLRTDKTHGEWIYTLRSMGDWANPYGIEVARFNSHVMSMNPGFAERIVDAINKELGRPHD